MPDHMDKTLLKVVDLQKHFISGGKWLSTHKKVVKAVSKVSFAIDRGETLGLVGESGCGKTTVGKCIMRLIEPSSGKIYLEGTEVTGLDLRAMKAIGRDIQIIFQDPYGALTPRMRLNSLLREPLDVHNLGTPEERRAAVSEMLARVGLRPEYANRFPHEFSGGQRQRIAIARVLMLNPKLIVADEPVSALDVSIQSQIINLMVRLQRELGLSYLFISHDLGVVKYVSDRIAVMYLGRIVEMGSRDDIYLNPLHPYTVALLSAIPKPQVGRRIDQISIKGDIPSPINPPPGCAFHPRCRERGSECDQVEPELREVGRGHLVACLQV
jgi:oligopeptide/dipeptide ABC transporter ATP-binding protein